MIIPLSSKVEHTYSFDVIVEPSKQNGLSKPSKLLARQIRVIDTKRLVEKKGSIEEKYKPKVRNRIELLFDLAMDFT